MSGDPADGHRRPSGHVKVSRVSIMLGESDKAFRAVADLSFEVAPGEMLGVIGPTRLNYARVIPTVDYAARIVSKMLGG